LSEPKKGFWRETVEFALDRDVAEEIERQRAILNRHPENARAAFDLAVLLNSQGRREEAIALYRKALALDSKMARAHKNLGEIYVAVDRLDLAWTEAERAAECGDRSLLEMLERWARRPKEEPDPGR
jgi:Flp pilus assembly protein TadD